MLHGRLEDADDGTGCRIPHGDGHLPDRLAAHGDATAEDTIRLLGVQRRKLPTAPGHEATGEVAHRHVDLERCMETIELALEENRIVELFRDPQGEVSRGPLRNPVHEDCAPAESEDGHRGEAGDDQDR
jgi:hypothetical protein